MQFRVARPNAQLARPASLAVLFEDNWDDWGKYQTTYTLVVFDAEYRRHQVGSVKIGKMGLLPGGHVASGVRSPSPPEQFTDLPDEYFSLGQDEDYYEAINKLPGDLRLTVLKALRDCAFDEHIFQMALAEPVMKDSLLRHVTTNKIQHRFRRIANGDPALSKFRFKYTFPTFDRVSDPLVLNFTVEPGSQPPSNVHVLIGSNGVGKTRAVRGLVKTIISGVDDAVNVGTIEAIDYDQLLRGPTEAWAFSELIAISFSAFDRFEIPDVTRPALRAELVGLKARYDAPQETETSEDQIRAKFAAIFRSSVEKCRSEPRRERLKAAIKTLESDPLFADMAVGALLDEEEETWRDKALSLFDKLSSGHAIVLLTIVRLVEIVQEKTLVLFDEPESHLHPPLLSAFIRAISDLLMKRNGVAVIATHSPVVLQEVPSSCVWLLSRSGDVAKAERPTIETFGENVGILTREVFRLEVTESGFHQLLKRAVEHYGEFDAVLNAFDGQLGGEAQSILRGLIALRKTKNV